MNPRDADRLEQAATTNDADTAGGIKPMLDAPQTAAAAATMWAFVVGPPLGLIAAVPFVWGWGLSALDVGMAVTAYLVSGFGLTVGYHRLFTHRSFKARRGLRIALAVAGSLGVEGSPVQWVANHRRHHAFADREGDPHSPWRYGTDTRALLKGLLHAHVGWMLKRELSNRARFAPDIAADPDLRLVGRLFGPLTAVSLLFPALAGGLVTGSWAGALTGFFWAGVIRMALLHHVTWSVNSVCHVAGRRPFASRDKATNFWPLALLSFGESWHNSHHADPTGARHGVLPGQLDPAARLIWVFERLRWVHDVRWPSAERLVARALPEPAASQESAA
ncbi:acyl-CoA desaturase [Actinacidiphila sp. ITFR-21]|uniref:acyl-CoA desaturase n=1 Tax=Actinacidiphila sp. ITFR-21 TaxID=3075199 RepID=UPI00288A0255|nr:fatty acid desaturase [Streptomyces sp. ITFR-21]WNI18840.1 fatty acid desaturase [Streptomyces sp. ITFR-21]